MRIGIGSDLHRLAPGRTLRLGGIAIDHDMGPVGHSDADVLLHAATDALLGAIALGDIGEMFPDSDPANYFGPPPSIDLEKYVWDGVTWHDADAPTGPSLTTAHDPVVFRFVITNNCGVNLTAVNLTDTDIPAFYTNQNCTTPAVFPIGSLMPTDPPVTVYGNLTWAEGQHSNNATATGAPS